MSEIINEAVAKLAYEYWETEGRPNGRHLDHWLRAERTLNGASLKETARANKKAKRDKNRPIQQENGPRRLPEASDRR
jgi:hypothetical protein